MAAERQRSGAAQPGERIAKRIARAGLCSRRDAERLIAAGRVALGGAIVRSPATNVDDASVITVDGGASAGAGAGPALALSQAARPHHQPSRPAGPGLPCSRRWPRSSVTWSPSGGLDFNSEGLLLLTNDGALARELELPSRGWRRRYRVRVRGAPEERALAALGRGLTVDGVRYGPIEARLDRQIRQNAWLTVSLTEGRYREIRIVLPHLGLPVSRLIRTAYGPFQLGGLARGEIAEIPPRVLREQLGSKRGRASADRRR